MKACVRCLEAVIILLYLLHAIHHCCSGVVVVSPSNEFTIFNENSQYAELLASGADRKQLPNRFHKMPFAQYLETRASEGRVETSLFFSPEFYYWQSAAPDAMMTMAQLMRLMPFRCMHLPSLNGSLRGKLSGLELHLHECSPASA